MPPTVPNTLQHDIQLLAAVLSNERGAADRLLREITPPLRIIVRGRMRVDEVEHVLADLLQALWNDGWRKLRAWRQDAPLRHYLSVIACNHCNDAMRRRRDDLADDPTVPLIHRGLRSEAEGEREVMLAQVTECLDKGFAAISPAKQQILRLRHEQGLGHAAIAEALEKSIGYVGSTLARAEVALKTMMTGLCAELLDHILGKRRT